MERPQSAKSPVYHLAPPALAVLLFYLPLALVFAPAPLYYALIRGGRKYGLTACLGASGAVFIISGGGWAMIFTVVCVLMALAAAEAFWRRSPLGVSIGAAAALPFAASLTLFALFASSSGSSVSQAFEEIGVKTVDAFLAKSPQALGDKAAVQELEANKQTLAWVVSSVFPAVMLNMAIFLAMAQYLFIRAFSIRFGWNIHAPDHALDQWRAPDKLVFALGLGAALSLFGVPSAPAAVGLNIAIAAGMIYSMHGLSLAHYWLKKAGAPVGVNIMVFAVMFLALPWAAGFLALLGLADTLADFRGISSRSGGTGQ